MEGDAGKWANDPGNLHKANADLTVINSKLDGIQTKTDELQRTLNIHKQEAQNTISNHWANDYEPLLEELRAKKNELVGYAASSTVWLCSCLCS